MAHAHKQLYNKSDLIVLPGEWRPRFSKRWLNFDYPMTLAAYVWFLSSNFMRPCDLDLWPFDLDGVSYTERHTSSLCSNFHHPTIVLSWVMDDSVWSHF